MVRRGQDLDQKPELYSKAVIASVGCTSADQDWSWLELTEVLLCCVVFLREAVKAGVCQFSTETHTQAGVVEVPVDRSLLAHMEQNIWQCSNHGREGETVLFSGSLDKVT